VTQRADPSGAAPAHTSRDDAQAAWLEVAVRAAEAAKQRDDAQVALLREAVR